MEHNSSNEVAVCLRKLCSKLSADKDGAYRLAISYLASQDAVTPASKNELLLSNRISARLNKTRTAREAEKFLECHQRLRNSVILKNRVAILAFLYAISPAERDMGRERCNLALRDLAQLQLKSIDGEDTCTRNQKHTTRAPSSASLVGSDSSREIGPPSWVRRRNSSMSFPDSGGTARTASVGKFHKDSATWLKSELPEREAVREALFGAQGVKLGTRASAGGLSRPRVALLARLTELGFLHDRVKEFTDTSSGYMPLGLVGEGLVSAIREELSEYYRSIAILQSQLESGSVTLRQMSVWSLEPLHRLKWLATIAHAAHTNKGGELASCVYRFAWHGDPRVHELTKRLLSTVCYPLYVMLTRWLLDGEIDDPWNEFFIESRNGVSLDRMWHEKYRVRDAMLPSFISSAQAQQILATGKSVVFMREACADADEAGGSEREALKKVLDSSSVELLFSGCEETRLHAVMSAAHGEASQRLLRALSQHHRLLDHLHAHLRYLLLAQGDFHHHLMRLIEPELNKPASQLYVHNLTCILESAVRATNAQYEHPDTLNRLHINLYPCQSQDKGWDVFSLQYRVDGPLGTLFPAAVGARYRKLFAYLWRTKRMEYSLAASWRRHTLEHKNLKNMPEVLAVVRRVGVLRAEAVRFCAELQHAWDVGTLEASWRAFLAAASDAPALDSILEAHDRFLDELSVSAMLHDTTKDLQLYLGPVFEDMLDLRTFEDGLYKKISDERERRCNIEKLKAEKSARGEYSTTSAEEAAERERVKIFGVELAVKRADFNIISKLYRSHVKLFILNLAVHNEVSLQNLAFRLDYNDFYKKGDSKLHEPLTYQYKRLSEIGSQGQHRREKATMRLSRKK